MINAPEPGGVSPLMSAGWRFSRVASGAELAVRE